MKALYFKDAEALLVAAQCLDADGIDYSTSALKPNAMNLAAENGDPNAAAFLKGGDVHDPREALTDADVAQVQAMDTAERFTPAEPGVGAHPHFSDWPIKREARAHFEEMAEAIIAHYGARPFKTSEIRDQIAEATLPTYYAPMSASNIMMRMEALGLLRRLGGYKWGVTTKGHDWMIEYRARPEGETDVE